MDEKQRTLAVMEHEDGTKWLAYESEGEQEQLRIDLITHVMGRGNGRSELGLGRGTCRVCDSSSIDVLRVLGWGCKYRT